MYEIIFYEDRNGYSQVYEFLKDITSKKGKDARINANKVNDYIQALSVYGTYIGEPICKHLDGDIWELRPLANRILFAGLVDGKFVLLHQFMKKTQKTPKREIEQAKRELEDYLERSKANERI
ncbi:Phage-related protein [Pseudobutyrivibrio sp. YE44]|uniref:type II toxin-antitoxin system RelE/ParE family toxin n=1 Tax=Pseudobutyrivibrio sp. YE44 TaxID=1520802 RepID=UPI00088EB496|nr:type II toxin-antitoxin system RelE/ParE family toxin [Pseudobutyrivibrio sp. YE44]SDB32893.1 Phage-related protein [Pseudobutyrivibrio sp. YE44]